MYVSRRLSSGGADGMSCPTVPDGGTAAGEGTAIGADATVPDGGTAAGEGTAIGADDIGAEACSRLLLSIAHGHGQLASVAPHSIDPPDALESSPVGPPSTSLQTQYLDKILDLQSID